MKLRTSLLLSAVLLTTGTVGAMVAAEVVVLQRAAAADVAAELARSRQVFEELSAYRQSLYRSESHVIADEPRLKAIAATEDVSRETVIGISTDLRKLLQSDLFLLTDGEGRLVADALDPKAAGFDLSQNETVGGAIATGEKAGVWTDERSAFQVHARALFFGKTRVGVVVIGYRFDDRLAGTVSRQTGSAVVVQLDGRPIALSLGEPGDVDREALAAALERVPTGAPEPVEITFNGTHYLAVAAPFSEYAGKAQLRYVVLRSLDRALAPARRLEWALYGIAGAALTAALLLAVGLSRRLTRRLDDLVSFAGRVGAGDLGQRADLHGPVEVQALAQAMNRMVTELGASRAEIAAKERLEREMEIGARLQTSILPRHFDVPGLEVAARMVPATEVGGDYYDVFPVEGGAWLSIGDVAGHGLSAGLVMIMVQTAIAALGRDHPGSKPSAILRMVNTVLYDNIRNRLQSDEHVTLSLLRYHPDGRLEFAGAHEEMIVCRAATGRCETVPTPGPWLGGMRNIDRVSVDSELTLCDGDVLVLYTDGVTEARDAGGTQLGLERLCAAIEAVRESPVQQIVDHLLGEVSRWSSEQEQDDDVTVLVLRFNRVSSIETAGA